jgi:hypothetical protein
MFRSLSLAPVVLAVALAAGCAARVGVYDPYYHDYHHWSDAETPYYNQWIVETHHNHVDYNHLNKHDKQDYWRWRHDHK